MWFYSNMILCIVTEEFAQRFNNETPYQISRLSFADSLAQRQDVFRWFLDSELDSCTAMVQCLPLSLQLLAQTQTCLPACTILTANCMSLKEDGALESKLNAWKQKKRK